MSDLRKWKAMVENASKLTEDPVQDADYTDHEVSMAKSQMLSSMKSINRIAKHLSTKSESEGLEGWTASKLTMAEDYLQVVADYFDGQEINEGFKIRDKSRGYGVADKTYKTREEAKKAATMKAAMTGGDWEVIEEGYKILPPMDKEKYQARDGLEGPFSTLSGKVVYYDPKAGKYYDPDTDMYLSYEEFQNYDKDYSGMKDERDEVKEAKLSPEQREELDDLIDMVKYGTSPSTYDPDATDEAMKALKIIRSKFGDKVADQVADGIDTFHFPRHGMRPGTYATDKLASKKPTQIKKDGKIDARSAKSTKRDIKSNLRDMGKKDPKRLGEEAEGEENHYMCVHAKKGTTKCTAKTSYEAAQKAAKLWNMKSTAGIDAHLMTDESLEEDTVKFEDHYDSRVVLTVEKDKLLINGNPASRYDWNSAAKDIISDKFYARARSWEEVHGYLARFLDNPKGLQSAVRQVFNTNDEGIQVNETVMVSEAQFDEAAGEKDACYHKVKSRYKVWPSAYASGALVKCRKVGAKNWGNSKK